MNLALLAGVAATGLTTGVAYATFHRNSNLFGQVLGRLPGPERRVALTFDDGPHPETTPRILDTLAAEQVPATFFVLGRHADRWPEVVRRCATEGHEVGNHGYRHKRLHLAGPATATEDILQGTRAIERACGVTPRLYRAPHGFRSPFVTPAARSLGQHTVGWTVGVWDTDRPGDEEIARRVLERVTSGAIILLHDADGHDPAGDRRQTADALPLIIHGLRRQGYSFVSLG